MWFQVIGGVFQSVASVGQQDGSYLALADAMLAEPIQGEAGLPHALAWASVTSTLYRVGLPARANALVARLAELVAASPPREAMVLGWISAARLFQALHDSRMPGEILAEASAFHERVSRGPDVRSQAFGRTYLGIAWLGVGQRERALAQLRVAAEMAQTKSALFIRGLALTALARALGYAADPAEARQLYADAVALFVAAGNRHWEGSTRVWIARSMLESGDTGGAEEEAHAAVALLASSPPVRAGALATLAQCYLAQGRSRDALSAALEARTLAEEAGVSSDLEAYVLLAHAESLRAAGRRDEAKVALVIARARLEARAASLDDERLRASFLEDVPENARTMALGKAWVTSDALRRVD